LERELWAEMSRESSGDGCLKREEPTSILKKKIKLLVFIAVHMNNILKLILKIISSIFHCGVF
jgi:hypothetical protein